MKKIFSLLVLFSSIYTFSQCKIIGKETITNNSVENYTIENDNAQCIDCHLWEIVGGNAQLEGDFRKNSIQLRGSNLGKNTLSLSMLTSKGFSQCSKTINVVDASSPYSIPTQDTNCDISIKGFKEVKYDDGIVSIFPDNTSNNFKYEWTAVYANGQQRTSSEKVPQFSYSTDLGIVMMKVKITSNKCLKNLSKTYDANFWKFF